MPFRPVNGPVIFIVFILDMDYNWKAVVISRGINIALKTGTHIIVGDIYGWALDFGSFIKYLGCQLDVYLSQNLSLSLKKCLLNQSVLNF
jgi:hypothetical protein